MTNETKGLAQHIETLSHIRREYVREGGFTLELAALDAARDALLSLAARSDSHPAREGREDGDTATVRVDAETAAMLRAIAADAFTTPDIAASVLVALAMRQAEALAAESRADGRVEDACDCPAAGRPSRAHAPNCPMRAPSPAREAATAGGDNSANLHKDRRDKSPDLQKDGWIACSERLPPDGVTVLGYVQGAGDPYFCTIRANVIASMLAADDRRERGRPTHWMPLPAAPTAPDATGGAE